MVNYKKVKFAIFIIFIVLSLSLIFLSAYIGYNQENVIGILKSYINAAPLIFIGFVAFASATTMPISVSLVPGILIFTFTYTIVYAFIGIVLGAVFVYFLSKYTGRDYLKDYAEIKGERVKILNKLLKEDTFNLVMVLNLVYFFPSNLAHAVAGLTSLRFDKFLFATMLGNYLNFFFVTLIFYGAIYGNTTYIVLSVAAIIIITAIPLYLYRKNFKDLIILSFKKKTAERVIKIEKKTVDEVIAIEKRI